MLNMSLLKQVNYTRTMAISFAFLFIAVPGVRADKVTDWNEIGAQVVLNTGRAGAAGTVDLAYMHIAIYDAVNAIEPGYSVFAVAPTNVPAGASTDSAVVEAAYRILIAIAASQSSYINQQYAISMATIPDGQSKTDGMAVGAEVAALFLAARVGDGRNANVTYTPGSGPGAWIPTSPAAPAVPWLAVMRPFGIRNSSQFLPEPPPDLSSTEWAEEYNEVKRMGAINSPYRTPEQTTLARVFLDPGVTQLAKTFRQLAGDKQLSQRDNARLFAYLYVAQGDATIAGFNAKYHYGFWRPVTAIRNGDTDGNSDTEADPAWAPLANTPNHPEYLSAHAFVEGAWTQVLRDFFGTKKLNLTIASTTTGTSMTFSSTDDVIKAVNDARVFAGFHYRSSCVRGAVLGRKVGSYIGRNYFQPTQN